MNAVVTRIARWRTAVALAVVAAIALVMQAVGGWAPARASTDGTHPSGAFSFAGSLVVGCPPGALLCTRGQFTGGLNGTFTLNLLSEQPSVDAGVFYFTGSLVMTNSTGILRCTLDGALDDKVGSEGEFGEICVITGGTGGYAHAKGDLRMIGTSTSTLLIPTGSGVYDGTLRLS